MLEGSTAFWDVLAIIIGFSAVMLLLSLLVTALAQAVQATLRLRARNLQHGLAAAVDHQLNDQKASREIAAHLLNSPSVAALKRRKNPKSLPDQLRGPLVSWADTDVLRNAMEEDAQRNKKVPQTVKRDALLQQFGRLEPHLRKRFGTAMRTISILCALVVAAVFQVSAPDLLRQLSLDAELRAHYASLAEDALSAGETTISQLQDETDLANATLDQLESKHQTLRSEIEQARGTSAFGEGIAEHLSELLEGHAARIDILEEYDALFVTQLREHRDMAIAAAREAAGQLSRFDITLWKGGSDFYVRDGSIEVRNILGVLVTAILLALGAPFWFRMLKSTSALRDALAPQRQQNGQRRSVNQSPPRQPTPDSNEN